MLLRRQTEQKWAVADCLPDDESPVLAWIFAVNKFELFLLRTILLDPASSRSHPIKNAFCCYNCRTPSSKGEPCVREGISHSFAGTAIGEGPTTDADNRNRSSRGTNPSNRLVRPLTMCRRTLRKARKCVHIFVCFHMASASRPC